MDIQQSSPNDGVTHITQRALELTDGLYTNSAIKRYDPKLEEQIAGLNRLYQGSFSFGRVRWLVSGQSHLGDYGVNRGGIDHLRLGLHDDKIVAGVVVLVKKYTIINKSLVSDVSRRIECADWLDLGRGQFCSVDQSFNLIDRDHGRFITDPDAPM